MYIVAAKKKYTYVYHYSVLTVYISFNIKIKWLLNVILHIDQVLLILFQASSGVIQLDGANDSSSDDDDDKDDDDDDDDDDDNENNEENDDLSGKEEEVGPQTFPLICMITP